MNTQSIIVYRNPLEQAFWEGAMSDDLFPIMVAMVVFLLVVIGLNWVAEKTVDSYKQPKWVQPLIWICSGLSFIATVHFM